jgi:hypothetical protein
MHQPGDLFPSSLQEVDGIAQQSREYGIEGGEIFQNSRRGLCEPCMELLDASVSPTIGMSPPDDIVGGEL